MAPYLGETDKPAVNGNTAPMLQITCSGTPYEIGLKHGSEAKLPISRTIDFYTDMFKSRAKLDWTQVREVAMTFEPVIRHKWPRYLEEMRGVAEGAGVELSDIVACNVRTEIAYGMFSDGCTALSWKTSEASYLSQNWDWQEAQKQNLIVLTIEQPDKPTVKMVTEAGLIGKIGLNSAGVGVCLNAIQVKGMDATRLPCHLGLRMALESDSKDDAVARLEECGVASACHMLIADSSGGIGLEWSSTDLRKCVMNAKQQVFHSNHYLLEHPVDCDDVDWVTNSTQRVLRIEQLAQQIKGAPTKEKLFEMFKDETNYPGSICRAQTPPSTFASLFNIVMDLESKMAEVTLGRPTHPEGTVELSF